jgi:hypothetical protein
MNERRNETTKDTTLELDELLHPARAFGHPSEVVCDPDLTLNEKRAILSSWASDACALEAAHELRATPAGTVRFDDIMDAMRELDRSAGEPNINPKYRRIVRRRRIFARSRGDEGGRGSPLQ